MVPNPVARLDQCRDRGAAVLVRTARLLGKPGFQAADWSAIIIKFTALLEAARILSA
jgi:hypothetical protein